MAGKNIKWFKIANEIVWKDNLAVAEAAGRKITLAKSGNAIFAFAYHCPHASGTLADGFLDAAGNIVCPRHGYRFSLANGRNVSGEGYFLKKYLIEERMEGLFVGFEENTLF